MRRAVIVLVALLALVASPAMAQERPVVRVVTNSFVLPAKFRAMQPLAQEAGLTLEVVDVGDASPDRWLARADLVILDVPRPNDRAQVEAALGGGLADAGLPSITIGGGPPAWQGIDPRHAGRLTGYYAGGGTENFRGFFAAIRLWKEGGDLAALPPPAARTEAGFWHPEAPQAFGTFDAYLAWGTGRWPEGSGRIGKTSAASEQALEEVDDAHPQRLEDDRAHVDGLFLRRR